MNTFQILSEPSSYENDARYFPELLNARHEAGAVWPSSVLSFTAVLRS